MKTIAHVNEGEREHSARWSRRFAGACLALVDLRVNPKTVRARPAVDALAGRFER
jgi:hypothetical protein